MSRSLAAIRSLTTQESLASTVANMGSNFGIAMDHPAQYFAAGLKSYGAPLLTLLSAMLYIAGKVLYQRLLSPLAKFPGPFWASITDFWRMYLVLYGSQNETIVQLHETHGDIVRIGPNELYALSFLRISTLFSCFTLSPDD